MFVAPHGLLTIRPNRRWTMPDATAKSCPKCTATKPLDDFPRDKRTTSGRGSWCKACNNAWHREHRRTNADALNDKQRSRYRSDPQAKLTRNRQWREANPERHKELVRRTDAKRDRFGEHLGRYYGLTRSDYAAMVAAQDVDHDHDTGRVRGLLCYSCNMGIGRLGDSEAGLLVAIEYLRRSASTRTI
ncbi:MAG: endonuclease domain-containing protein [Solirubrobacteraceae bacterium]